MRTHSLAATAMLLTPVLALLLSAAPVGADGPPAGVITAQMVEGADTSQWGYTPQAASLSAGQDLVWTNIGAIPHTATEDSGRWDTGLLSPGATASVNFAAPGTYAYHCTLHPWMKGTVVVIAVETNDASPADSPPGDVAG
jgi:plastocyanin